MIDILKDWQPGDAVEADQLNAMAETLRKLDAAIPAHAPAWAPAGVFVEQEGPVEWPWQVYLGEDAEGERELRVVPGDVLVEQGATPGWGVQWESTHRYATLDPGMDAVQDVESLGESMTVYLELTGDVQVEYVTDEELPENWVVGGAALQRITWGELRLRVTVRPAENALRVWPLATFNPAHAQPLTQLQWGTLSALEVRGVCNEEGTPLWPADRSEAPDTKDAEAHKDGMDTICTVNTGRVEHYEGTLAGCLDLDGALELYMGNYAGLTNDPPDNPPPVPVPEEDIDDDDPDDPPPWWPIDPDDPPNPPTPKPKPPGVTRVRYGYVAGEGFSSCELMTLGGELYWILELDPAFLPRICQDLECPGTVTYNGNGTSAGAQATVEMGLGACTAQATGTALAGTAALVFHGTNDVDASKKRDTVKFTYKCSPQWTQTARWALSPKVLHQPGRWVRMDKGTTYSQPFVKAYQWYRFRIDKKAFRKAAEKYFRASMEKVQLSGNMAGTSADTAVTATLAGTMRHPVLSCTLQDIPTE